MTSRPQAVPRVLLEDLIDAEPAADRAAPLVGEVLDARHPVLQGRAQVRWHDAVGTVHEAWLPCLQGVTVRTRDRVLLQQPANWPELLVVGVVDGFATRPAPPTSEAARLQLQADETLTVTGADEQPLLEIQPTGTGCRVRLLREDVDLELPGRLQLSARELTLRATAGDVTIDASDDAKRSA
jgi:hypothetical protein